MLVIRLARHGAKKKPFYHVVVSEDSRIPTSRAVDILGFFNPLGDVNKSIDIDTKKVKYWVERGARPSKTVAYLLKKQDII